MLLVLLATACFKKVLVEEKFRLFFLQMESLALYIVRCRTAADSIEFYLRISIEPFYKGI